MVEEPKEKRFIFIPEKVMAADPNEQEARAFYKGVRKAAEAAERAERNRRNPRSLFWWLRINGLHINDP